MRTVRALRWFALAAVLAVGGAVALNGTARDVMESVAFLVFLGAAIRQVALSARDDLAGSSMASGRATGRGYVGWMATMSGQARRRRAAVRRAGADDHRSAPRETG